MRTSLKERIIGAFVLGGLMFIIECILYNTLFYRSNWMEHSVICSASWSVGYFIGKTFTQLNKNLWQIILIEVCIGLLVYVLLAFILGTVLNMSGWSRTGFTATLIFWIAVLTNNKWIRDDD